MTGADYLIGRLDTLSDRQAAIFHPNATGHQKIANMIQTKIAQGAPQPAEPPSNSPFSVDINVGVAKHLAITGDDFTPGTDIRVQVPGFSLSANTIASLFTHSDPIKLGDYQTDDNGGLDVIVHIPDTIADGFHLLTIQGSSPSGEPITYYQFVTAGLERAVQQESRKNKDAPATSNVSLNQQVSTTKVDTRKLDLSEKTLESNNLFTDTNASNTERPIALQNNGHKYMSATNKLTSDQRNINPEKPSVILISTAISIMLICLAYAIYSVRRKH